MTTVGILTKAKHLIEKNGFVRGSFIKRNWDTGLIEYCALGAVRSAADYGNTDKALRALYFATDSISITIWNDEPRRTKEEVLEAFDKAIEIAQA